MKRIYVFFGFILAFVSLHARIPHKVVICGVCKDVASRVPYSMKIMEKIGAMFDDYRIVVYENNSTDSTATILRAWANANFRVRAITEYVTPDELNKTCINRMQNGEYFRPELIARARNIVLDIVMSPEYQDFEYLVWMDMDFILEPAYQGIQELFQANKQWDAVFAYGVAPDNNHWDWYALRDDVCPFGPELLGHYWFQPKKLQLSPSGEWYPVYSAFGGFGIYKKKSIQGCRYSALVTRDLACCASTIMNSHPFHAIIKKYRNDRKELRTIVSINAISPDLPDIVDQKTGVVVSNASQDIVWRMNSFTYKYPAVCEHVTFHASMIMNGYDKLFINPRLKFYYGDSYPRQR